jgi:hypothetical protein
MDAAIGGRICGLVDKHESSLKQGIHLSVLLFSHLLLPAPLTCATHLDRRLHVTKRVRRVP